MKKPPKIFQVFFIGKNTNSHCQANPWHGNLKQGLILNRNMCTLTIHNQDNTNYISYEKIKTVHKNRIPCLNKELKFFYQNIRQSYNIQCQSALTSIYLAISITTESYCTLTQKCSFDT